MAASRRSPPASPSCSICRSTSTSRRSPPPSNAGRRTRWKTRSPNGAGARRSSATRRSGVVIPTARSSTRCPASSDATGGASRLRWAPSPTRPLDGLRVVDLTRVLAGPTCGRTLAAFGADVLHVSGPTVPNVPAFVIDTGHGKRQAFCEFTDPTQLAALRRVAIEADVVVQGYRPGVVARVGLDESSLRADGFGGVYATVSAFGPDGPWADRAGWEQLAQAASGLCLDPHGDERPTLLPCAFTDYTTGFVLAAGIMESLAVGARRRGRGTCRRVALPDRGMDPARGSARRGGHVGGPRSGDAAVDHRLRCRRPPRPVRRGRRSRRPLVPPDHAPRAGSTVVVMSDDTSAADGRH